MLVCENPIFILFVFYFKPKFPFSKNIGKNRFIKNFILIYKQSKYETNFNLVELAGGINNFSPMLGNNASQLMKNLQQLISSNPEYLTSGIPTHLIQQMWNKEPGKTTMTTTATTVANSVSLPSNNVMLQSKVINKKIIDVCYYFLLFKLNKITFFILKF